MNSLKDLRQAVKEKDLNKKIVFKTNGDFCPVTKNKVYAMYCDGDRLSHFYPVHEWNHTKINISLLQLK